MRGFPVLQTQSPDTSPAERLLWDLEKADGWDRYWRRQQFEHIPEGFALPVARHYRALWTEQGEQQANVYLLQLTERIAGLAIAPSASDGDVVALAKRVATTCRHALVAARSHHHAARQLMAICRSYEICPPPGLEQFLSAPALPHVSATHIAPTTKPVTATQHLRPVAPTLRPPASAPTLPQHLPIGTLARLTDDAWWRRKLRVVHGRLLEAEAIRLHQVHRFAGLYVSDATFARHQQQRKRNQRTLASLIAVNESGNEIALDEIVARSLSNPANRRAELMVRIYGFDQLAIKLGHEALLLTVTCPSYMHAHLSKSGAPNPKFDPDSTPRAAQSYLTRLWSQIRASWQRQGIRPYGFRITEAHHDGTPHWHMLLFIDAESRKAMEDTVRAYVLKDSPDEQGAQEHRFQVEVIDRNKGSATGYVAKYISKNIDGHGLESTDGKEAPGTLAQRVAAWSSTWGIRQFQQVGGPPVSLWREFRHAPHLAQTPGLIGQLARAADEADWAEFVELLGGPQQPRKELQISLAKRDNPTLGRYGEPIGLQTFGVSFNNVVFPTRLETWRIMRKAKTENCTLGRTATRRLPPDGASEHQGMEGLPPWSSVNKCTLVDIARVGRNAPEAISPAI